MTSPNPFAAPAQAPAPQQQPAAAPAPAVGNPFGPGVAAQPRQAPAPAANPYAAPAPAPQQQYAAPAPAPQQQYAPQQQAQGYGGAPQLDASRLVSAPAPIVGEGKGAKLADMFGRLVLVFPLGVSRVPRNPKFITQEQRNSGNVEQDRLTATVVVLDGGRLGDMTPIAYGGEPHALPPTPHTESAPLPYVRKAMWITQSRLISQCRDSLNGGMVAGRLTKSGPAHNDPWELIPATAEEVALVNTYIGLVQQGQYPNPLA